MMASYPALVQLIRMLGRTRALAALGCATEPRPETLTGSQRRALAALVDEQLGQLASELASEAAASDDVAGRAAALVFVNDRLTAFADLITPAQVAAAGAAAEQLVADWN